MYRKTAKTFLAASVFLEILKTFGELDPEVRSSLQQSLLISYRLYRLRLKPKSSIQNGKRLISSRLSVKDVCLPQVHLANKKTKLRTTHKAIQ